VSKSVICPTCGSDMDCEIYEVSRLWGTFNGKVTCRTCGRTIRPKRMEYDTAQGAMMALRYAAVKEDA